MSLDFSVGFAEGANKGAEDERKAIVEWLLEMSCDEAPFGLDGMESLALPLSYAAAEISRGEHLK